MSEQFAYNDAKDLEDHVTQRGLPEGSTWADVTKHDSAESLKDYVAKLGLPEGSTWADVNKHNDANRL